MKIYTRTGDDGTTGLLGGDRVAKDCVRIEAYGAVDELNSTIGVARVDVGAAERDDHGLDKSLQRVQGELFSVGAELADASSGRLLAALALVGPEQISLLEREIDLWQEQLEPLSSFILPGGAGNAAGLHLARTVCRRAERAVLSLAHAEDVREDLLGYLNRLSDHLFVAARMANRMAGVEDVQWPGSP